MSDTRTMLDMPVSSFREPPKWPAGNYLLAISGWAEGTNKNSGASGIGFTVRAISCIEADDMENPELAAETNLKLEAFGDWTAKEHSWMWPDKETKENRLFGFCPVNFLLQTEQGELHTAASFLYLRDPVTGIESGFVPDVLKMSVPEGTPTGEMLDSCVGRQFYGAFAWEENPKRPGHPNLTLTDVSSA